MGTLVIEEFQFAGSVNQPDTQIAKLDSNIKRTSATTSTTPATLTLQPGTRIVAVYGDVDHRLSVAGDTTTNYATVKGTVLREFGVDGGGTITYRSDT